MGNAPQPRPPIPNDHRVVIPITTTGRPVGTKLRLLPPLSPTGPGHSRTDLTNLQPATYDRFPPPLEQTEISREEYATKLGELKQRLASWKGGWALMALFCLSVAIVGAFVVSYCIPVFWTSPLFDHPFYLLVSAVAFVLIYVATFKFANAETQKLFEDVEDICFDRGGAEECMSF